MTTEKKDEPKRICECPFCDNPCALPLVDERGWHNFVPHIIGGEVKNVCVVCKTKLLQAKQQR